MSGQHVAQPSPTQRLLAQTQKQTRALIAQVSDELLAQLRQLRELSRPVRRKSQYPAVRTLAEAAEHLEETANRTFGLYGQLKGLMKDVYEQGRREKHRRGSAIPLKDD